MRRPASTWPTTPRIASATIVSCVMARALHTPWFDHYADRAGVAELVRRARLKIGWPSGHAGSGPAPGTLDAVSGARRSFLLLTWEHGRRKGDLIRTMAQG